MCGGTFDATPERVEPDEQTTQSSTTQSDEDTTVKSDLQEDVEGTKYRLTGERRRPNEGEFFLSMDGERVTGSVSPESGWPTLGPHNDTTRDIVTDVDGSTGETRPEGMSQERAQEIEKVYLAINWPQALIGDAEDINILHSTPMFLIAMLGSPVDLDGLTVRERTEDETWDALFETGAVLPEVERTTEKV